MAPLSSSTICPFLSSSLPPFNLGNSLHNTLMDYIHASFWPSDLLCISIGNCKQLQNCKFFQGFFFFKTHFKLQFSYYPACDQVIVKSTALKWYLFFNSSLLRNLRFAFKFLRKHQISNYSVMCLSQQSNSL